MERKQTWNLGQWLTSPRRKPLIIRGARQVGKSTLVRMLAEGAGRRLIAVNLERHAELDSVFATLDLAKIIPAIESLPGSGRITDNDILFLDEIQATPHALAALRYFHEERPQLAVVAAGSLLEFVLADHDFAMPVGRVRFLHLHPMDFEEFLAAVDEPVLLERLRTLTPEGGIDAVAHSRLRELFTLYSFVGGMPEAVSTWVDTRSPIAVREVQSGLIDTYKADFAKYGLRQDMPDLHLLFDRAARNVGRKVKYAALLADEQSRTVRRLLNLLISARLFYRVHHADCQGMPLRAGIDDRIYKLLMLDVGLFNAVRRFEWSSAKGELEESVAHRGALAEQLVGQELLASGVTGSADELVYWLREGRGNNAEVDYVIAAGGKAVPIEVKSGETGSLKSLFVFADTHRSRRAVRLDLGMPSLRPTAHAKGNEKAKATEMELLSLPIYAAGQLGRILGDDL